MPSCDRRDGHRAIMEQFPVRGRCLLATWPCESPESGGGRCLIVTSDKDWPTIDHRSDANLQPPKDRIDRRGKNSNELWAFRSRSSRRINQIGRPRSTTCRHLLESVPKLAQSLLEHNEHPRRRAGQRRQLTGKKRQAESARRREKGEMLSRSLVALRKDVESAGPVEFRWFAPPRIYNASTRCLTGVSVSAGFASPRQAEWLRWRGPDRTWSNR